MGLICREESKWVIKGVCYRELGGSRYCNSGYLVLEKFRVFKELLWVGIFNRLMLGKIDFGEKFLLFE